MDKRPQIPDLPDRHIIALIVTVIILIAAPIVGGVIGLIIDGAILIVCILSLIARQVVIMNEVHEVHLKLYDLQEKINKFENIKSDK